MIYNSIPDGEFSVGHIGQLKVMCYYDICLIEGIAKPKKKLMQFNGGGRIKVTRGLIGQQYSRGVNKRPCNRNPLLLAPRKF